MVTLIRSLDDEDEPMTVPTWTVDATDGGWSAFGGPNRQLDAVPKPPSTLLRRAFGYVRPGPLTPPRVMGIEGRSASAATRGPTDASLRSNSRH